MKMAVDIETYSSVDLAAAGVRPYTEAPDFEILLIAYKLGDQQTKILDLCASRRLEPVTPQLLPPLEDDLPAGDLAEFLQALSDPDVIKTAFNAVFERTCLARYFDRPMPAEQWRCTMVLAYSMGLSGSLGMVGEALGLDKQKMVEGKQLITYFCKPCKPTSANGYRTRNRPEDAPDKWLTFKRYCIRDVDAEDEVRQRLAGFPIPEEEQRAWEQDQHINDLGVRIDTAFVKQALALDEQYKAPLMAEARQLTGLENPNSMGQLKEWLAQRGVKVDSLDKKAVPKLIEKTEDPTVRRVLELRQELSKTSTAKYEAMERGLCRDGRVHNILQYYGAGRTGRWAGRLVQVQNLPQNKIPDLALARELVANGEFDLLQLAFGAPPFVLSQLIRTAFIPSEGARFIVADYSAIEARVLAWIAGEKWVLEEFRGDGLIYEATASMMFHVPKMEIKKGGPHADLRPKGKVATLACGYQGSKGALINMGALESGIPEEDLPGIVQSWRRANPHIVKFWYDVEAAAVSAIEGKPKMLAHGLKFWCEKGYLFIQLPSRRRLAYYKPELEPDPEHNKMAISYMGTSQQSKAFLRRRTYGGMLTENIVQATARDCLRDAMRALWAAGYEIVMHIHDEVVIDAPVGFGSLDDVLEIMGRPLRWAPGLPLRAAGFETDFYMKD